MDETKHPEVEAPSAPQSAESDSRPDKQPGKTPIYLHPRQRDLIRKLSEEMGKSYGDVVAVALKILQTVLDKAQSGHELAFIKDGRVQQTLLLLM